MPLEIRDAQSVPCVRFSKSFGIAGLRAGCTDRDGFEKIERGADHGGGDCIHLPDCRYCLHGQMLLLGG